MVAWESPPPHSYWLPGSHIWLPASRYTEKNNHKHLEALTFWFKNRLKLHFYDKNLEQDIILIHFVRNRSRKKKNLLQAILSCISSRLSIRIRVKKIDTVLNDGTVVKPKTCGEFSLGLAVSLMKECSEANWKIKNRRSKQTNVQGVQLSRATVYWTKHIVR
jgi:hypothetical protein